MAERKDLSIPTDIHLPGAGITADQDVFEKLHQAMVEFPPNSNRRCRSGDQVGEMPLQIQIPAQIENNA